MISPIAIITIVVIILLILVIAFAIYIFYSIKNRFILSPAVQKYIPPRTDFKSSKIPKKIFQTFVKDRMHIQTYHATRSWIKNNPEYSYYFFDDADTREYIKNNFDKKVLKAFDMLVPGAYKADLWRYCVLYKEGGVYADIRQVNLVPLRAILDSDTDFVSVKDWGNHAIFNAFICTVPGHPFMKKTIEMSVDNILNKRYNDSDLDITGPETLGKAILSVLGTKDPFKIGKFESKFGKFELLEHDKYGRAILKNNLLVIQARHYGSPHMDKLTDTPHYTKLWKSKGVYK